MMILVQNHMQRLYNLGARKVIVVNVGPIGCIPYQREINLSAGDNCVNFPNVLAQLYNTQLRGLVSELSSKLTGSKFVYADAYGIVQDIIQNYSSYGEFYYQRLIRNPYVLSCLQ